MKKKNRLNNRLTFSLQLKDILNELQNTAGLKRKKKKDQTLLNKQHYNDC